MGLRAGKNAQRKSGSLFVRNLNLFMILRKVYSTTSALKEAGNWSNRCLDSLIIITSMLLFSRNFLILVVIYSGSCCCLAKFWRVLIFSESSELLASI